MADIFTVKCPECGSMQNTTTTARVRCFGCGYSFIARDYLTKEQYRGKPAKKEWAGFITAKEMLQL